MVWKLFKRHSVCTECRVYFEPYILPERCLLQQEIDYLDLCPQHRQPRLDRKRRQNKVMAWALTNWETLEPQALAEETKRNHASQTALQAAMNSQANQFLGGLNTMGLKRGIGG